MTRVARGVRGAADHGPAHRVRPGDLAGGIVLTMRLSAL